MTIMIKKILNYILVIFKCMKSISDYCREGSESCTAVEESLLYSTSGGTLRGRDSSF